MEGFLQWEELGGHEVPAFYHSCVVRESQRPLWHLHQPLCREEKAHQLTLAALVEKPKASKQTGAGKVPEGKKRRQTSLTGMKCLGIVLMIKPASKQEILWQAHALVLL